MNTRNKLFLSALVLVQTIICVLLSAFYKPHAVPAIACAVITWVMFGIIVWKWERDEQEVAEFLRRHGVR